MGGQGKARFARVADVRPLELGRPLHLHLGRLDHRRKPRLLRRTRQSVHHSAGLVLIRAADFSAKPAQAPRPCREALIKTVWRGADRVGMEWIQNTETPWSSREEEERAASEARADLGEGVEVAGLVRLDPHHQLVPRQRRRPARPRHRVVRLRLETDPDLRLALVQPLPSLCFPTTTRGDQGYHVGGQPTLAAWTVRHRPSSGTAPPPTGRYRPPAAPTRTSGSGCPPAPSRPRGTRTPPGAFRPSRQTPGCLAAGESSVILLHPPPSASSRCFNMDGLSAAPQGKTSVFGGTAARTQANSSVHVSLANCPRRVLSFCCTPLCL